jgi:hypothetical protein
VPREKGVPGAGVGQSVSFRARGATPMVSEHSLVFFLLFPGFWFSFSGGNGR